MENFFSSQYCTGLETFCFVDDPFFLEIHPFDFSNEYYQCEFPIEGSAMEATPFTDNLPRDPMYDIIHSQGLEEELFCCDGIGVQQYDTGKQMVLYDKEMRSGSGDDKQRKEKEVHRFRSERKCINSRNSTELTRAKISRYFYMPITQAAKELNVGLTLLKKRCRELGITRWPHRKLMSLQTLMKNVQEMELHDGQEGDLKIRNAMKRLEEQLKLIEKMPEVELEDNTKKLRQACFKANYKKRKHMKMLEWPDSPASSHLSLHTVESSASATIKRVRMHIEEMQLVP